MTRRLKKCVDECMRPEVKLNPQWSAEEGEEWHNSTESLRRSFSQTYCYASDVRTFDRSQEHPALRSEMEFYRRMGLNKETYEIWCQTHGPKRAASMMFGVVFVMVLGGVSGIFKTLLRNGLVNLLAVVVSAELTYRDVVMLEIKGDDMDAEFSREVEVENTTERMGSMFNLSVKFYPADVRYMCKQFRLKVCGRWYHIADPWAKAQSMCTPIWIGDQTDDLAERWVSLVSDLRHYDNGILVDKVAEAAQRFYGISGCFFGMARALSGIREDRQKYFKLFGPPEVVR